MSAIHDAAAVGDSSELARIIQSGGDISEVDRIGRTALMYAALDDHGAVIDLLLDARADVDAQDNAGNAALHFAAQEHRPEVAQKLLNAGAKVDIADTYGNTPLSRAVFNSRGRGDLISLLSRGADRNRKNKAGRTPLQLAETIGNYDVRRFF